MGSHWAILALVGLALACGCGEDKTEPGCDPSTCNGVCWTYQPDPRFVPPTFAALRRGGADWTPLTLDGEAVCLEIEDAHGEYDLVHVCVEEEGEDRRAVELVWVSATRAEITELFSACPVLDDSYVVGRRTVSVSNLDDANWLWAVWGGEGLSAELEDEPLPSPVELTLEGPEATHDLVVTSGIWEDVEVDRVLIQRDVQVPGDSDLVVDMESDGVEPVSVPFSLHNVTSGHIGISLLTASGTSIRIDGENNEEAGSVWLPPLSALCPDDVWQFSAWNSHGPGVYRVEPVGAELPGPLEMDVGESDVDVEWEVGSEPWLSHVGITWAPTTPADLVRGEIVLSMGDDGRFRVAVTPDRLPADGTATTPDFTSIPGWEDGWSVTPLTDLREYSGAAYWFEEGNPAKTRTWLLHSAHTGWAGGPDLPFPPSLYPDVPMQWRGAGDSESEGAWGED